MKLSHNTVKPARIEMMPLIDIVFLLLVFFIYAMLSMAVYHGQPVDLPVSDSVRLDTEKSVAVTIQARGEETEIFVDEVPINLEDLTAVLREKYNEEVKEGEEIRVFGDKAISYRQLFQVLDRIKAAGISRISLAADVEKK